MTEGLIDYVCNKYLMLQIGKRCGLDTAKTIVEIKQDLKAEIEKAKPDFRRGATVDMRIEMDYILTRLLGEKQ